MDDRDSARPVVEAEEDVVLVLRKLEEALDRPPYNYIIHTAPFDHQEMPHYHWHIQIIPRLTKVAGFEWGSGFYINPVPPEEAAGFLRDVEISAGDTVLPLVARGGVGGGTP